MKTLWFVCEYHQWLSDQMRPCPFCVANRNEAMKIMIDIKRAAELEWTGPSQSEIEEGLRAYLD